MANFNLDEIIAKIKSMPANMLISIGAIIFGLILIIIALLIW